MLAAESVGDDRLQKQAQGYVVPDSFTHGSSEERMTWLKRGLESGDINQCNTFNNWFVQTTLFFDVTTKGRLIFSDGLLAVLE